MGIKDQYIYEESMKELDASFRVDMKDYEKELRDCSEKMIEISEECKVFFKKRFETSEKNDETEKNSEGT